MFKGQSFSCVVVVAALAGTAASVQAQRIFDSGPTCTSLNVSTGLATLLGFSAGNLGAGLTERWSAQAFTLANQTQISEIGVNGFDPADVNQSALIGYDVLKWVIWRRLPGNPAPTAADQLFTGQITTAALGPGQIDPRGYFANLMLYKIPVQLTLAAGDYWLTVYGDTPNSNSNPAGTANFAWFSNAQLNTTLTPPNTPIVISDGTGVFMWRSATFPTPGFERYTAAPTAFLPDPAPTVGPMPQDPQYFYNSSFYLGAFCNANCDSSTNAPCLNVNDFTCFLNEYAIAQTLPAAEQNTAYANCDRSTIAPVLNVNDFTCYLNKYAAGCFLPCAPR